MLQFSQTAVSFKRVVLRGVAGLDDESLPKIKPFTAEKKPRITAAPAWLALDPSVWPCQIAFEGPVISATPDASSLPKGSSYFERSSSPASSAAPSIFSQDNSSTSTVSTMPSPIPSIMASDYDAEKAGRRSNVEWEYKDMFLAGKGGNTKVRQLSKSNANSQAPGGDPMTLGFLAPPGTFPVIQRKRRVTPRKTANIWGRADGPIPVPSTHGFSVIAPATGFGPSRTTGKSLKIGMGMYSYTTLAKYVAEQTYRNDHDGMVFSSKVYTGLIVDQHSYDMWLEWKIGRPAEDRVLWVIG